MDLLAYLLVLFERGIPGLGRVLSSGVLSKGEEVLISVEMESTKEKS